MQHGSMIFAAYLAPDAEAREDFVRLFEKNIATCLAWTISRFRYCDCRLINSNIKISYTPLSEYNQWRFPVWCF
jgi:hypothetical protein